MSTARGLREQLSHRTIAEHALELPSFPRRQRLRTLVQALHERRKGQRREANPYPPVWLQSVNCLRLIYEINPVRWGVHSHPLPLRL